MSSYTATNSEQVQNAKKKLQKLLRQVQIVPIQILAQEAVRVEAEAKNETPLKSGKLESSVKVSVSRSKSKPGLNLQASARSKGFNYAGMQHDRVFNHPLKGKDHYLSDPFKRAVARIKKKLKKEIMRDS